MVFNELRTLAFRIAPDVKMLPHHFVTLGIPEDLKRLMRKELATALNHEPEKTRLRVSVLNKAVRMLVPDLISITRNADETSVQPWLYGYGEEPASASAMQQIMRSWIYTSLPPQVPDAVKYTLASKITTDSLIWQKRTVDLTRWETATNGTAMQSKTEGIDRFVLLPDLIAARLCQPGIEIEWGPHQLRFRRCPSAPGRSGTELISWPPLIYEDRQKRLWPYSIILTLTLQTVAFQPFPELHCDISIRRWAGPPIKYLPGDKETSVYLLDSVPWIEGIHHSNSFQVAPIVRKRIPKAEKKDSEVTHYLTWNSDLVKLLDYLSARDRFPHPQDLVQTPDTYLRGDGKPSAAIVYRNGIDPAHEVGPGLMPIDRHHFAERIKEIGAPELVFIDPPQRKKYAVIVPENPFMEKEDEQDEDTPLPEVPSTLLAHRRLAVAHATNKQLTLGIWYQSNIIRDALLQALHTLLGYPSVSEETYTWTTDELSLTVQIRPLGAIGDALDIKYSPSSKERRPERLRSAIRQRVEEISVVVPSVEGRVAALIELDAEQAFGEADPKYALRIGFAQVNWLTQFITPYKENKRLPEKQRQKEEATIIHRATAALRDLLRQCGVIGAQPQVINKGKTIDSTIPDPLHYLGIWLIKQYAPSSHTHIPLMLPLVVHMASDTHEVYVKARGFRDWLSYPDTLLALANGQAQGVRKPKEALPFIMDTLNRFIPTFPDTMLFYQAQNFRSAWTWLTNEHITKELPALFSKYKHLRIIRVRTGEHETPEWYAQSEEVPYGLAKGVFTLGESGHVFASIQDKPPTVRNLSKELSKGISRSKMDKEGNLKNVPPNPTVAAWNPGIVEMTISCTDSKEALMCATIADELRQSMASHYNHPTVYPIPLHLASLIEEYVLPLEGIEENDAWNDLERYLPEKEE
jgi:pPIWI_RE module N-terminal domain/RNaseH domain of pPIWI_RE/MID domain of pPIWI_RE